ncbi:XkdF-like putative serine protease domain-containing protein [bacterium]|nr:XkdF-like putative serine protease domain-containing protein [bacterium]
MEIIELVIDENEELSGIEAISVVESPAIEEDFIALKNQEQIRLAEISKEKRLLMGAALIPEKPIYRKSGDHEFYIYFSKDTVAKASQMYLKAGNQGQATMEHTEEKLDGMTVVESWIVEDAVHDKSRKYGLDMPIGTWMVSMKVDNDDIWNNYVKENKIKGFSIEGYFADKLNRPQDKQQDKLTKEDKLLNEIIDVLKESNTNTK